MTGESDSGQGQGAPNAGEASPRPETSRIPVAKRSAIGRPRTRPLFRIAISLLVLSLLAGGYVMYGMLRNIPVERAATRNSTYEIRLDALDDLIPEVRLVAELVTNPDERGIVQGLVTIVQLENRASDIYTIASEPLPGVPPLAPSQPVDDLAQVQERMLAIADRSETIAERLSDTISYRKAFGLAFEFPTLPLTAADPVVDAIGDEITLMLETSVNAAANLPDDAFFEEHRGEVDALIEWLTDWQDDYLAALRGGDAEQAGALVTEAHRQVDLIEIALERPLAEARDWSIQAIEELDRQVDEALLLTG